MMLSPTVYRVTQGLLGQPCWNVEPGLHPCLTLEFGAPYLKLYEPTKKSVQKMLGRRTIDVCGEYHLWTYNSDWEVHSARTRVGCSEQKKSIPGAARLLDGQIVDAVRIDYRGCRAVIHFDFGGRLTLKPRHDAYWLLFTPRHMVLAFRGDKMFSYRKSDADPNTKEWKAAWHPRGM